MKIKHLYIFQISLFMFFINIYASDTLNNSNVDILKGNVKFGRITDENKNNLDQNNRSLSNVFLTLIKSYRPELKRMYRKSIQIGNCNDFEFVLGLNIDTKGSVTNANIVRTSCKDSAFLNELIKNAKKLNFGPPTDTLSDKCIVNIPFIFECGLQSLELIDTITLKKNAN